MFIDKINIKKLSESDKKIILELGSGNKKNMERINIDILDLPETDIIADLEKGLEFISSNSIDEIHASSILEHISNLSFLMEEIYRVLKPNGILYAFVPHFSNPYFYSDPTHKRFFGLYTFSYFSKSHYPYRRKVPKFYYSCNFRIESQKITFNFPFPFKILGPLFNKLFNSRYRLQEIFEFYFSPFLPCYGLNTELKAIKNE